MALDYAANASADICHNVYVRVMLHARRGGVVERHPAERFHYDYRHHIFECV